MPAMATTSIELIERRRLLGAASMVLAFPALARAGPPARRAAPMPPMQVWKGPACGCCKDWVAHLQANGFTVQTSDEGNTDARAWLGIDLRYGSCHTAMIGGYAVEGHVPAADIRRLLKERPDALGLAVPGMPVGSPGMDGPEQEGRKDPYDVLLLARDGSARVFQSYR